ncbi:hypothetical protein PR048_018738 [Dryococelus australis]|uniref:C2H2-type domain-containing protein n=1 Tax=Dryococelus australis TaxID=614101 RepID=A0ABQ9HDE1_9NEOP|nr:hypothetical protein PR048_018738 [Dryococelus australis]
MKRSHYESHIRSHQTDRPFVCSTCGKGYKERKHYCQHAKKMHPNEFNLEALIASITCEDEILCPEPVPSDALFSGAQSVLGPDTQMMDKPSLSPSVGMFSPSASFPNLDPLLQDINSVNFIATSLEEHHQSLVNSISAPLAVLCREDTTSVLSQTLEP